MQDRTSGPAYVCHSCGGEALRVFYQVTSIPVHSVLLLATRESAMKYPRRDLALAFCQKCGFIFNVLFDPGVHEYSSKYEETQGFSPTFNAFHRRLVERLINQYDLYRKDVIEIGCGKGEFLSLLCELGDNRGLGFDPAYVESRSPARNGMRVIADFYSDRYDCNADFVCCKMTLEHIQNTAAFVGALGRSLANRPRTVVFFQVPNVTRILRESAFWDIYYEHCSYFSSGSLARLFETCGFVVIKVDKEYDDQYLTIESRPTGGKPTGPLTQEESVQDLERDVLEFEHRCVENVKTWKRYVGESASYSRMALWGGGSKAVAFLTTLGVLDEIPVVVDINPYRDGTYIAGTGQRIVPPDFLRRYKPDVVIIMNPLYRDEIQESLSRMGLSPALVAVHTTPSPRSGRHGDSASRRKAK